MSQKLEPRNASVGPPWDAASQDRFVQATLLHTKLQRLKSILRRDWWIVALSLIGVGGPAVFYAATKPPAFQSQVTMWMAGKLNLPEGRLYAEELTTYLGTQTELIKSPTIRFPALKRVLARFPEIAVGGTNAAEERLPFTLTVKPAVRSSTLELRATGPTAEATQMYVDAAVSEYLSFKRESRNQTSVNALSTITDQIKELERQIQRQQEQLTTFQTSNNIAFLTESGASAGSHLARLNEQLSELRTEYRLLELLSPEQFKDMTGAAKAPGTGVAVPGEKISQAVALSAAPSQSGYYPALQQLHILKAKRDEFAPVLRPAHSKMIKLNQEIAALEKLLATLKDEGEQQAMAQMASRRKSLELQLQSLDGQYRAWETNAIEASRKLADHERIKQQVQRSQALYDRLLSLVQAVDLNRDLDQESLSPLGPASPARLSLANYKIGAAGICLGLLLGGAVLMMLAATDDRFTSLTELSLHLPEDVLGQIPESTMARSRRRPRLLRRPGDEHAFAESFRNLRSTLICMSGPAAPPKVFLVTSAVPKEGKTTVAAHLGASLASGGARVLLVDADLRRSKLHKILRARLKPGLREVLGKLATPAEAIVATEEPNLFFLPAGEARSSSSDVFLRSPVAGLLQELGREYDYVVFDTAPVLATDDATSLGPRTDGVFVVVRAAYTSSRMTREALSRLHQRNIKVLGVIYNRAEASGDYYYRYSSDYHDAGDAVILPAAAAGPKAGGKNAA